jgi:hypothetical protein
MESFHHRKKVSAETFFVVGNKDGAATTTATAATTTTTAAASEGWYLETSRARCKFIIWKRSYRNIQKWHSEKRVPSERRV